MVQLAKMSDEDLEARQSRTTARPEKVPAVPYVVVDGTRIDVDENTVLPDGQFRDAWELSGDVVQLNLNKAKRVWVERLIERAEIRIPELRRQIARKEILNQPVGQDRTELTRLITMRLSPQAINTIRNATTLAELRTVTVQNAFD